MTENLTIGERVAWYRRRRGLSQEVLAGLVGRTTDWLSKAENNRIELDRLSVITSLADALDVSLGDLLAEPALMEWSADSGHRTVPALRETLMDYKQLAPLLEAASGDAPPALQDLRGNVGDVLDAYQASRYGFATRRLPLVLADALAASRTYSGHEAEEAHALLALAYHGAAMVLGKVGESELAWIAADRGLAAAQHSGRGEVTGSLFRAVTHCLLATGRFTAAVQLVNDAAAVMQPELGNANDEYLSVYGTLFLTGAMAAARAEDRATTQTFLREANEAAQRLGADANHMWTAFGPTNVAIHCVATAGELGDIQIAADLGSRIDTTALPVERRVRHNLEVARALSSWNRTDEALAVLLEAEQAAPEQVRHHYLSRELASAGYAAPGDGLPVPWQTWPADWAWSRAARVRSVSENEHEAKMARPRMAAGALFFDEADRVLLVEPSYKDYRDIPGGYVEEGESPRQACVREVQEELGIAPHIGRLLVVDWAPNPGEGDKVLYLFDGGCLSPDQRQQITLQADELRSYDFYRAEHAPELTIPRLARRIEAGINARTNGLTAYLEHGKSPEPEA